MTEDQFMTYDQMASFSRELEEAGFRHVVATHLIDPQWRQDYRPNRPELDNIAWTIRLTGYLVPMDKIKVLIEVCERHDMVFWMDIQRWTSNGDEGGTQFTFKIGSPTSRVIPSGLA